MSTYVPYLFLSIVHDFFSTINRYLVVFFSAPINYFCTSFFSSAKSYSYRTRTRRRFLFAGHTATNTHPILDLRRIYDVKIEISGH